jgi:hypothetical protein
MKRLKPVFLWICFLLFSTDLYQASLRANDILVKLYTGENISIDFDFEKTVEELKEKILEIKGIPVDQQVLLLYGDQMKDEKTLSEYTDSKIEIYNADSKLEITLQLAPKIKPQTPEEKIAKLEKRVSELKADAKRLEEERADLETDLGN